MPGVLRMLLLSLIFIFIVAILYNIVNLVNASLGIAILTMNRTSSFTVPNSVYGLSNVPYVAIYAFSIALVILIIIALILTLRGEE